MSPASDYEQSAFRAFDFLDSIGVNTHLDFVTSAYSNLNLVINAVNYLGVNYLRDSANNPYNLGAEGRWQKVADATGVKFNAFITSGSQNAMQNNLLMTEKMIKQGIVTSVEGVNEADSFPMGGNTLQLSASFQQKVFELGQTYQLPVINMSFGQGWGQNPTSGNYGTVGDLSMFSTYANAHTYFSIGSTPGPTIEKLNDAAQLAAKHDVIITEMGWYTKGAADSVSEQVQAKYMLSGLLDAYESGSVKTYLYELLDQRVDPHDIQDNFGLFRNDGTPKAAATALHNLTSLLDDNGTQAGSFTSQTLDYSLSGLLDTDNSMLMQKSDGSYWLAIWNETRLTSPVSAQEVQVASHKVTLSLLTDQANISIYDPLTGQESLQSVQGARVVEIDVPAHPVIIKIADLQAAPEIEPVAPSVNQQPAYDRYDMKLEAPDAASVMIGTTQTLDGLQLSSAWSQQVSGYMAMTVTANRGIISMTNDKGEVLAGSGTSQIKIKGTVTEFNQYLDHLHYTSPLLSGADSIRVEVWNQAGMYVTDKIAITNVSPFNARDILLKAPVSSTSLNVNAVQEMNGLQIHDDWQKTAGGTMSMTIATNRGHFWLENEDSALAQATPSQFMRLSGTLEQLNQQLEQLHYKASSTLGADQLKVTVWNQAGFSAAQNIAISNVSPFLASDMQLQAQDSLNAMVGRKVELEDMQLYNPWAGTASGSMSMIVTATRGTLSIPGQSGGLMPGSGTASIKLTGSLEQLNQYLDQLAYSAPSTAGKDAIKISVWNQAGVSTSKTIQVNDVLNYSKTDMTIDAPATAVLQSKESHHLSGLEINNQWAGVNPGAMVAVVSASRGKIFMEDTQGNAVAGSGSGSIRLKGTLDQINQQLETLHYNSQTNGSDTLRLEVWNQAGVYTKKSIAVSNQSLEGANQIVGNASSNLLSAGKGADKLTGGEGADIFHFNRDDTGVGAMADHITDFSQLQGDKIQLQQFGLNAQHFKGMAQFAGNGQASIVYDNSQHDGDGNAYTVVKMDMDGDRRADHEIHLDHTVAALQSSDFIFV